jgi:hypothetical protein
MDLSCFFSKSLGKLFNWLADNVNNNETRGTVFLKYNEAEEFCNILLLNDTFLILVKFQPIKVTVHLVYIELEFFVKK